MKRIIPLIENDYYTDKLILSPIFGEDYNHKHQTIEENSKSLFNQTYSIEEKNGENVTID